MNFGNKTKFFSGKFFNKNFFGNKQSFNVFNSNVNSVKSLININNKYYTHKLNLLSKSSFFTFNTNLMNHSLTPLTSEVVSTSDCLNLPMELESLTSSALVALLADSI